MSVENGDMMRYAEVETGEDWRKPWLENTEEPEIEPDGSWCKINLGEVTEIRDGNPKDEAKLAVCTQEAAGHLDPETNPEACYGWDYDDDPEEGKPPRKVSNTGL